MAVISLEEAKVFLQIPAENTTKDALIEALIPEVDGHIIEYCNTDFYNQATPPVQVWPAGMKLIASKMIGYNMTTMSGGGTSIGMQSESQGEYSYDRGTAEVGAYPNSITKALDKYKITRAHFANKLTIPNDRRGSTLGELAADKFVDSVDGDLYKED